MKPESAPLLALSDLSASYAQVAALKPVSLQVRAGELVTIVGPNGAGKSTLLRAIMRLVRTSGSISYQGSDVTKEKTQTLASRGLILVPEGRGLFAGMTVLENLVLGAYTVRTNKTEVERRLADVFSLFPRLKSRTGQTSSSLSGGEQQMLAVGRGLMAGPKLLLLDEPSLGLAPRVALEILETLRNLNSAGLSILLVEQKAPLALKLASRAYVLKLGAIAAEFSSEELSEGHDLARFYLH